MKKALIFDPYLDTLGGGERYSLTFAMELKALGFEVEIAWHDETVLKKAQDRFGLNLSGIKINLKSYEICVGKVSLLRKYLFYSQYDLTFWVSDGSLPFLFSKTNLVHFQVPFKQIGGTSLINKIKSLFISKFVYNSRFTQSFVEASLGSQKSFVLYPPVDTKRLKSVKKERIILSVARFDSPSHPKRQDILIKTFRSFSAQKPNFKLILAGGCFDSSVLKDLENMSKGLSVEIIPNPKFSTLNDLYSSATFFWHAAGFEVDENNNPDKVEHFGMTTVEAMASSTVPLVINKGGQKEVIEQGVSGYLCEDENDLASKTIFLIDNPKQLIDFQRKCLERSEKFSLKPFVMGIKALVESK